MLPRAPRLRPSPFPNTLTHAPTSSLPWPLRIVSPTRRQQDETAIPPGTGQSKSEPEGPSLTSPRRVLEKVHVDAPRGHAHISDDRAADEAVLDGHLSVRSAWVGSGSEPRGMRNGQDGGLSYWVNAAKRTM
jgi:hypothetical protein